MLAWALERGYGVSAHGRSLQKEGTYIKSPSTTHNKGSSKQDSGKNCTIRINILYTANARTTEPIPVANIQDPIFAD